MEERSHVKDVENFIRIVENWIATGKLNDSGEPSSVIRGALKSISSNIEVYASMYDEFQRFFLSIESKISKYDGDDPLEPEEYVNLAGDFIVLVNAKCIITGHISLSPVDEFYICNYLDHIMSSHPVDPETYYTWRNLSASIYKKVLEKEIAEKGPLLVELQEQKNKISDEIINLKQELNDGIDRFQDIRDKSFKDLEIAFNEFRVRKEKERANALIGTVGIGVLALAIAIATIACGGFFTSVLGSFTEGKMIPHATMSLFAIEIILIYFFRISLQNYYSARDECLQLEIREALCRFAPKFVAFSKDSDQQLDDFAKHIFSPLVSSINKSPHPIDIAGQLTGLAKTIKKGS